MSNRADLKEAGRPAVKILRKVTMIDSKRFYTPRLVAGLVIIPFLVVVVLVAAGQIVRADPRLLIQIVPDSAGKVVIEGDVSPSKSLSFRDSYADVLGLGSRITNVRFFDSRGGEIPAQKIAPGQYEAASSASKISYEVTLTPPRNSTDAAKVSWLESDRGLLMLADLFPVRLDEGVNRAELRTVIRFALPPGWSVHSNESLDPQTEFTVTDPEHAVFAVGRELRVSRNTLAGTALKTVIDGDWAFKDSEALDLIEKILRAHREMFGAMPSRQVTVIVLPFSTLVGNRWSAETRGETVTLLIGKILSRVGALARLSTPLAHELLHLWVPNALRLTGDYAWFYEGFTVYEAASTAVKLDLLTFAEFLNAIAWAYDSYLNSPDPDRWSLLDASARRWTVGQAVVYQKSMIVAFIFDLRIRTETRNKRSLSDLYRAVFREYAVDGNSSVRELDASTEILKTLNSFPGMQSFGSQFIERPATINLQASLAQFGLEVEKFGLRTRVSVSGQLSKEQRDLLRQMGYNDLTHNAQRH